MLAKEKESGGSNFDLPHEVLELLPSDPFEQLDVARKITSIALSTRVSALESESSDLRRQLSDKDSIIAELQAQIHSFDSSLSDTLLQLSRADQEKESLLKENASLSDTVRKLNRDVAKLESFRKTLMRSLQDEEENSVATARVPSSASLSSQSPAGEDEESLPLSSASSITIKNQFSDVRSSYSEDAETEASRPHISPGLLLASQTNTPRLTPPGSPPSLSASASPTRTSKTVSPRRHSVSFSTTRSMFDDRSSVFSSVPSSQYASMSGSDAGSQTGRTRVDGKEFFRQVSDNAHDMAEEMSEGVIFAVGDKRIVYSNSSVSLSASEFRSLDIDEENMDEPSSRRVVEDDTESEAASSKASTIDSQFSKANSSDSTFSKFSSSDSEAQANSKFHPQWRGFLKKLKKGPTKGLHTFHPSLPAIKKLTRKKSRQLTHSMPDLAPHLDAELYCFEASWKNFSLVDLQNATNNFSHENLIGEGGYSEVYKGHLQDGQLVAIKRLIRGSPEEMTSDFLSELGILVHVNHPNISNVIGYGVEGGMHLVLPLSPHGSLASLVTAGQKEKLEWEVRYNIAVGTASGLSYLHEGCQRRIIHRDIKAANILLTEDFEPRISDFGLAKWLPDQWTHLTVSQFEGTFGYLAPEIFMHGVVDEKTDVYAYGVLLLELITGRPALDKSQKSLVMWATPLITSKNIEGLVDPLLGDGYSFEQLNSMVFIAAQCIHQSPTERPSMNQVVRMLKGDEGILDSTKKFQKRPAFKRMHSVEFCDEENFNSASFIDDLNQQNQIALELSR